MILVAWTLWVEIQFYFVIALFLLVGALPSVKGGLPGFPRLSDLRWIFLLWIALLCFDRSGLIALPPLLLLDGYAPVFLCGALFGTVLSLKEARRVWPFLALSVGLMWFAFKERAASAGNVLAGVDPNIAGRFVASTLVVLCIVAAIASLYATNLKPRVAKWVTLAAMATYPLYLLHQELGNRVLIVFRENLGMPTLVAVLLALVAVVTVSMLISAKFEPPARKWLTSTLKADQKS